MKARLKTTIENIKFQKDICLFDDYEKLEEVQNYIEELQNINNKLYKKVLDYSNEIEEYRNDLGYNLTFGEYAKRQNENKLKTNKMSELKMYKVGVEVIENPSKEPNKITYTTYEVEATSEFEARQKASELCGKEFMHNPYTTEII